MVVYKLTKWRETVTEIGIKEEHSSIICVPKITFHWVALESWGDADMETLAGGSDDVDTLMIGHCVIATWKVGYLVGCWVESLKKTFCRNNHRMREYLYLMNFLSKQCPLPMRNGLMLLSIPQTLYLNCLENEIRNPSIDISGQNAFLQFLPIPCEYK